ncbi:T9SS type A sorting domain-containing protein [candidate division KSB1 bacterium]|nr:T9SS type A sorting domain-containing protein [candidate division KSB1 bacterium]
MRLIKLFLILFCVVISGYSQDAPYKGKLGINISLPERGGTFVDLMKESYRWVDANSWASLESHQVDAQGWPTIDAVFVHDARPVAEWSGDIDDPEVYRIDISGTYSCSLFGSATISVDGGYVQNSKYDPLTNRTYFDFIIPNSPGPNYGFFSISFTQTQRTSMSQIGSGFSDFKMVKPGYAHDTDQLFTDDFISTLTNADFSTIRFMDFRGTNGSEPEYPAVIRWEERKLTTDASQNRIGPIRKNDGAAWEYVIELANQVEMDVWINIQLSATDEYVRNLAEMFKSDLDSDLNVYVESSNEVWNTAPAFQQSVYNQLQADALSIGEHENHARRTVQLAQLFKEVFGEGSLNNRIRVVLCSHAPMLKWWVEPMLQYVNREFGPPADYIYMIARQTYFGGGTGSVELVSKILSDCRDEITNQMSETSGNQAGRLQWVEKAVSWNLVGGCGSYEGGPDHGGGTTVNVANQILAERDAEMGEIFKYNLDDAFFALGANLAMQFTLTSAYTRYGCWGLTDDVTDPDRNYKFQAVRDLIGVRQSENPIEVEPSELKCYPNPFRDSLNIEYSTSQNDQILIKLFNSLGQCVQTFHVQSQADGSNTSVLNTAGLSSGVYMCTVERSGVKLKAKVVLIR